MSSLASGECGRGEGETISSVKEGRQFRGK